MGVQREPGQKGVSWSNIAVGMLNPRFNATSGLCTYPMFVYRCHYEHGN